MDLIQLVVEPKLLNTVKSYIAAIDLSTLCDVIVDDNGIHSADQNPSLAGYRIKSCADGIVTVTNQTGSIKPGCYRVYTCVHSNDSGVVTSLFGGNGLFMPDRITYRGGSYWFGTYDKPMDGFPFPFVILTLGDKRYYFNKGQRMFDEEVMSTFGELPTEATFSHQFKLGYERPQWTTFDVVSQASHILGISEEDTNVFINLASVSPSVRGPDPVTVNGWTISHESRRLAVSRENVSHLWSKLGSGMVYHDDNVTYVIPHQDHLNGMVFGKVDGNPVFLFAVMNRMINQYANRLIFTGVREIIIENERRDIFIHNGEIISDEGVRSILDEVPVKFTDEQVMALTLSL